MTNKTLRILFPQWQGGNNPPYYLGSLLLSYLSPNLMGLLSQFRLMSPQLNHRARWMALRLNLKLSNNSTMQPL